MNFKAQSPLLERKREINGEIEPQIEIKAISHEKSLRMNFWKWKRTQLRDNNQRENTPGQTGHTLHAIIFHLILLH